jgi:hypothetical protein
VGAVLGVPEDLPLPGLSEVSPRGRPSRLGVLTVSYPGGRTRQFSIPADQKPRVEKWLEIYQELRATLEAIRELNHELLRAEP